MILFYRTQDFVDIDTMRDFMGRNAPLIRLYRILSRMLKLGVQGETKIV